MKNKILRWLVCAFFSLTLFGANAYAQVGIFDSQSDVGPVKHPGTAAFDQATQQYTLTGAGTNIWGTHDEFHFVWKKMKGDFILRANIAFIGKGVEDHRKIGWMVRSSLDTNSKHINAVLHGDGLTSLQFRRTVSGATEEMKSTLTHADVIQLERIGHSYIMSVAHKGETFVSEKLDELDLGDDVYVGIFICSHNADVTEKATFDNVRIVVPAGKDLVPYRDYLGSSIEILDVEKATSKIIYQIPNSLQAPNWTKDGRSLIYNRDGKLYNFDLATGTPKEINTGVANKNNNDHVISFDGKMLTISSGNGEKGASLGFTVPIGGGQAKQITPIGPSYMHGWSPDGKYLVFCGNRNDEYDVYRIPSKGGPEVRLTTAKGL